MGQLKTCLVRRKKLKYDSESGQCWRGYHTGRSWADVQLEGMCPTAPASAQAQRGRAFTGSYDLCLTVHFIATADSNSVAEIIRWQWWWSL